MKNNLIIINIVIIFIDLFIIYGLLKVFKSMNECILSKISFILLMFSCLGSIIYLTYEIYNIQTQKIKIENLYSVNSNIKTLTNKIIKDETICNSNNSNDLNCYKLNQAIKINKNTSSISSQIFIKTIKN